MAVAVKRVDNNVVRKLAEKLAFGFQDDKVRLKIIAVQMAKKRNEDALRTTSRQGADKKDYFFPRVRTLHSFQSITSPGNQIKNNPKVC